MTETLNKQIYKQLTLKEKTILIAFVRKRKNQLLAIRYNFLAKIKAIEFRDEILNSMKLFSQKQRTENWVIRGKHNYKTDLHKASSNDNNNKQYIL